MVNGESKIFGIGLSRTGTSSLTRALEMLGYKTMNFPGGYMTRYTPGDLSSIDERLIDDYDAITDAPVPSFYKELDAKYTGSKFILTVRDMKGWLPSCKRYFTERFIKAHNQVLNEVLNDLYGCDVFEEDKFRQGYSRFVSGVSDYFKDREQDLLVMNICEGDGWMKLCSFLGRPVPDVPFPHEYKGENIFH